MTTEMTTILSVLAVWNTIHWSAVQKSLRGAHIYSTQ